MNILIASSGAGGHFSAGLVIADELKRKYQYADIFILCSDHKNTKSAVEKAGYKFKKIYTKGLLNKNLKGITCFLIGQTAGFIQSLCVLAVIRPRIMIGTGGFVSVGVIVLGRIFGIKSVIHEQNIIPGKANKLLAPIVDRILLSYEASKRYFPESKCIVTGMPVRYKNRISKSKARLGLNLYENRFTVLIMGGSKGAHGINRLILDMLNGMNDYKNTIQFIHLTGYEDYEELRRVYRRYGYSVFIQPFSNNMETVYSSSDLAISRSGSSSLSEIAYYGLPAVFIPYPYSMDKHQSENAGIFREAGAAVVYEENNIFGSILRDLLVDFINNPEKLRKMSEKSAALADYSAGGKIADEIERLCTSPNA